MPGLHREIQMIRDALDCGTPEDLRILLLFSTGEKNERENERDLSTLN